MTITDLFRSETITGRVLTKYRLYSGNIGVIIENDDGRHYSVEFKTNSTGPCFDNLYGLINEPFKGKGEYLEKLIDQGNYARMTVSYSKGPIRTAYRLESVSSRPSQQPSYYRRAQYVTA